MEKQELPRDESALAPKLRADCTLRKEERAKRDRFDFKVLAPGIADLIDKMDTPNCVGIMGPWGSGKSTLAEWVRDEIVERHGEKVKTVFFTTWQYDQGAGFDMVYALATAIQKELFGAETERMENVKSLKRDLLTLALAAGSTIARIATQRQAVVVEDTVASGKFIDEALALEDRWVSAVGNLHDKFGTVVDDGLRYCHAERCVVFLDDLGRCLPQNVVTLLEELQNFLMVRGIVFVIVADRAAVYEAIRKTFNYDLSFGDRYLDKITTVNFEIAARPNDELFMDLLSESMNVFGVTQPGGPVAPVTLYQRFRPIGLDNPRFARKVATKFIMLSTGPMSWVSGDSTHAPPAEFVVRFMRRHPANNVDKAKEAVLYFWLASFAIVALRQVFPIAFSAYDETLLKALQAIAKESLGADRKPIDEPTAEVIRRAGISDSVRGELADAVFTSGPAGDGLLLAELKYVYDKLGPWL